MNKFKFLMTHPEIQDGAPVFTGTRVRFETFCDYMRIGVSMDDFLAEFPSVAEDQAEAALDVCRQNLSIEKVATYALTLQELRMAAR
jgi:uncharacterized protein (DUF433 family)